MTQLATDNYLDFLNALQKKKLSTKFRSANAKFMPHELATSLGLTLPQAHAILVLLTSLKLCESRLLIYHLCSDPPVTSIPFGIGFPPLPWTCPECGAILNSYDEMTFDLLALPKEPIEFT